MKKNFLFIPFLMVGILNAYDLNEQIAKMQEKASMLNVSNKTNISDEMMDKAKQMGYTYDAKQSEIDVWKQSMSYENGKMQFNQKPLPPKKQGKEKANMPTDERVYIFISSSVPKETLKEYARTIDAVGLGRQIIMVMRGCIGGCEKVKPTMNYIRDIITDGGVAEQGLSAQVWIDPLLFRRYRIDKAPTVVYAKNVQTQNLQLSEGLDQNLKSSPIAYKSEGDWDLETHIKALYNKTKSPTLQALLVKMQSNGFYNTKK